MRATILAAALAATTALSACSSTDNITTGTVTAESNPMDSVVKIIASGGMGHGSGVHVGNGYILTAAHVVDNGLDHIAFEGGASEKARVLWSNAEYDVALLRLGGPEDEGVVYAIPAAELDCRAPRIGEDLMAMGSPGREDFLSLVGRAASAVREAAPNWKEVVVTDIAATGGISGGPILAEDGRVVGLMVGGMLAPIARVESPESMDDYDLSQSGISYIVPASAVCMLMGKEVV